MGPRLDDATAWLWHCSGMLKHVPTELLHWAVEDIIQREQWRSSHAAIRKGIEARTNQDRMVEQCRGELTPFAPTGPRQNWKIRNSSNSSESLRPTRHARPPPLITEVSAGATGW